MSWGSRVNLALLQTRHEQLLASEKAALLEKSFILIFLLSDRCIHLSGEPFKSHVFSLNLLFLEGFPLYVLQCLG